MMKILHSFSGLALTGFLTLTSMAGNGQWTYVGTPGFSAGTATYQSLAIGSDGTLYVGYNDQSFAPSGKAVVMKYNGSAWVPVGTPGFTAGTAEQGSLTVSADDSLYFSFQDGASGTAAVMKFDGTDWVMVGSTGISTGAATYTCMEVDQLGIPYVGYIDAATGRACVKKFDGVNWVSVGPSVEVSPGNANYLSMDLDASGMPWIGFADGTASNNMTVMQFNGTSWTTVGTAGFSGSLSGIIFADLTISPSNEAYVAYSNPFAGVRGNVRKFDGTTWVSVGSPDFTADVAIFNTVTISPDGTPYLAFMDSSVPGSKGSVMKYDASTTSWNYVGPAGFSGTGAGYLNSVMNGNTYLYVSNSDGDYGGNTSVMRYQLCNHASVPVINPVASVCEGDTVMVSLTGALNADLNWEWYAGNCHGTAAGTGTSIEIVASDTMTLYVSGEGTCMYAGDTCATVTIYPLERPDVPTIGVAGAVLTSSSPTGNQWALNGTDIPGATGQVYTAAGSGWYTVTVTNTNGCSSTSDSVLITITGIDDQVFSEVNIYPVPFSSTLNIHPGKTGVYAITVSDIQGRTVYTASLQAGSNSLDLSHLVQGVYYIALKQEDAQRVYRVVKQ